MSVYVMLTNLTPDGKKTVKEHAERIKEVNKEIEALGAKILLQYALLGPYDFINVLEAPDNQTIAKVINEFGSRGTIESMTMAALPIEDLM